jgi:uncharacterized protein YkuJ
VLDESLSLKKEAPKQGDAADRRKKLTKSSNVVWIGKKPIEQQTASAAEEGTKVAILTRLQKMEDEDERERIRTFERMRKSGALAESEYADEPDDSFDQFLRFEFQQEGEALGDGETPAAATPTPPEAPAPVTAAAAMPSQPGQPGQLPQRAIGASARGGARTKAPHEYKRHHQKDRAMRKRSGMFPK